MNANIKLITIITVSALFLSTAGCSGSNDKTSDSSIETSVSETSEKSAQQIRTEIIGEWGRLGETMHEFYDDGACIIGGMYGSYEITDERSLVTTTEGGTVTEYKWNGSASDNSWNLDGDTITVNGSSFTRVQS
ncbi:MAG: hypothetical protein IIY78_08675 [Clostridia bacterium]|nr:hypothetical protein [Clostridia bacterium]